MNPQLASLHQYPFERLNALKAGVRSRSSASHIALSIGEPKHAAPAFVVDALRNESSLRAGLGAYPPTRGGDALRQAIGEWAQRRFQLPRALDPMTEVLPVAGTREALFSFGQAMLTGDPHGLCAMPNPFYQIYEGAALLRGATPYYLPCPERLGFQPDFDAVPESVWQRCELVYLCTPGNPSGASLTLDQFERVITLADRHDFIIASDECYSEIFLTESQPPIGLLQACARLGRTDFRRCVVFHSLSKRSSLPGLRSGFVAGDAQVLEHYLLYRTYHGCALPAHVQDASRLAWSDERHVVDNRDLYRAKFAAVTPIIGAALGCGIPDGGFYFWAKTPIDGESFARELFAAENVTVLPGRYLARPVDGSDPGRDRVRMAWVAPLEECIEAADRIARFLARG